MASGHPIGDLVAAELWAKAANLPVAGDVDPRREEETLVFMMCAIRVMANLLFLSVSSVFLM